MNTPLQTNTIYLDSLNCVRRSPNFLYDLATPIRSPVALKMLLSVENVTFKNTLPNVTNGKMSFIYDTLGLNGAPQYLTFNIPTGIYSMNSFKNEFNEFANNNIGTGLFVCKVDMTNFKFSFASTVPCSIINTVAYPTTIGRQLGVTYTDDNQEVFPINSVGSPAETIFMPRSFDWSGGQYVFLKMSAITLNNINSLGDINDTLLRVPINCNIGYVVNYRPTDIIRFLIERSEINTIAIRLEDQYNNVLSPDDLQVVLRVDFIVPPEVDTRGEGTIDFYWGENQPTEIQEEDDEDTFGV